MFIYVYTDIDINIYIYIHIHVKIHRCIFRGPDQYLVQTCILRRFRPCLLHCPTPKRQNDDWSTKNLPHLGWSVGVWDGR